MVHSDDSEKYHVFHIKTENNSMMLRQLLLDPSQKRVMFDAQRVMCEEQVTSALLRASQAEKRGKMIANNWNIEVLLHLAATHQIKRALQLIDVSDDTKVIVIVQENGEAPVPEAIPGFPALKPSPELINRLNLSNTKNPCLDMITKGVRLSLDYE
ncbi:MAG: KEOPS complex subunit Cgi121 [Candidatus Kariarchaeaceae archaeon]|jgi:hypothetical protein